MACPFDYAANAGDYGASMWISRIKSRVDVSPKVTLEVTRRCQVRVSAGQKVTANLTVSHAPRSQKSHVFPLSYKRGIRDFSDPSKITNPRHGRAAAPRIPAAVSTPTTLDLRRETAMPNSLIDHDAAVDRIAAHFADRDAFIVLAGISLDLHIAERLSVLNGWTAYAIDDRGCVMVTDDLAMLRARSAAIELFGLGSITLFTIPKTVPATRVGEALGQTVPAGGSRDVLTVSPPDAPVVWPMVFVEALRRVDPKTAAILEANSLANLS